MRRIPILIVMGATSILASAGRLQAQFGPGGPYSPGGVTSPYPILSPWLNLEQKQGGPVDNYHMYVQPQLQLQSTLQAQQYNIARNSATVDALGDSVTAQQAYDTPALPRVRWPASTPTESISTRSAEGILLEWVAPPTGSQFQRFGGQAAPGQGAGMPAMPNYNYNNNSGMPAMPNLNAAAGATRGMPAAGGMGLY